MKNGRLSYPYCPQKGQFCETLSSPSTEITVCPREKFAGCVKEDRSILLQLISDDSQSFVIKDTTFVT